MRQYKSWIAALILGSTLSTNAQQKNMENKTLNENIPEMIISLEKEALASTDPMAFVELSDTDVIYFDPSLETKIEGLEQLRTYYKGMQLPPADHFDMIRPIVQVTQNIAVLTFNLDSYLSDKVIIAIKMIVVIARPPLNTLSLNQPQTNVPGIAANS